MAGDIQHHSWLRGGEEGLALAGEPKLASGPHGLPRTPQFPAPGVRMIKPSRARQSRRSTRQLHN